MGFKSQIVAVVLGVVFFFIVTRYIKKKSFNPSFSVLWIIVAVFLISVPLLEKFYKWFSISVLGIDDARTLIFIALIGFLLIYNFNISAKLSKMSDQIQMLISHNGYLETEIDKLKQNKEEE
jgi:hypothetical protein